MAADPPRIPGEEAQHVYDSIEEFAVAAQKARAIIDVPSELPSITKNRMRIPDPTSPAQLSRQPGTQYFVCVYHGEWEAFYRTVRDEIGLEFDRLTENGWVQAPELIDYFIGREYGLREVVDVTDADIAALRARG